jgi:UDP-N-acetylmuramoylalanine--D-glutamate ligase
MELKDKRVMVIGLGVSGSAAAQFLAARGARLVMTDRRVDLLADQLPAGELRLGVEAVSWLEGVELIVASPGVPRTSTLMQAAEAATIPVIGELELAARFVTAPLVAVTGTNGKSTVTTLLAEIFSRAGLKTFAGGNLGTPLIAAVERAFDVAVVEVSSYQLETIMQFKPRVAVHLNLSADHLDRYRSVVQYGTAKARIFANQDATDWAILNRDDPQVSALASRVQARVLSFGRERPAAGTAVWGSWDGLEFDDGRRRGAISLKHFRLPGPHNRLNAMAAAAAALAMEIPPHAIEAALAQFKGLPHRLEFVRERDRVRYLDDSKGTNVGAVVEALNALAGPVVLIAGGVDKGGSYAPLRAAIKNKVKRLILIGAAREKMREALGGATAITCVETLTEAVALAAREGRPGDTVMLSPACSSFDQFKDYAERGRVYQELVRAL